jgi:hypothetical protein
LCEYIRTNLSESLARAKAEGYQLLQICNYFFQALKSQSNPLTPRMSFYFLKAHARRLSFRIRKEPKKTQSALCV